MVTMSGGTRLFVGNIPKSCSEDQLRNAFATYGEVINVDIKTKPADQDDANKFAFITLGGNHKDIESCIQNIPYTNFNGAKLHVTRARESFLERLQRERQQEQTRKENPLPVEPVAQNPVINLSEKLNPRKRKADIAPVKGFHGRLSNGFEHNEQNNVVKNNKIQIKELTAEEKKKQASELKRLESMKKKRQEFKQRQNIIKTGLVGVDKAPNTKLVFSDNDEDDVPRMKDYKKKGTQQKTTLFEDDESDNEVNFEIKKQFEGKKGQKVLQLQSKFKSDKRFVLDERFVDEDSDGEAGESRGRVTDDVNGDVIQSVTPGERATQMDILQKVLGVEVRSRAPETGDKRKQKIKLGMPRFDPMQPSHAKYLAPVEERQPESKKKKKMKDKPEEPQVEVREVERVEASKEQFYKVSDTLKESIAQPNTFSLRSLFGKSGDDDVKADDEPTYRTEPTVSKPKQQRMKNPLEPSEKNPFKYDSSDSEDDVEEQKDDKTATEVKEDKVVWNEPFFFSSDDKRLSEGLEFFSTPPDTVQKERRELKSLMKKRLYNHERKDHMFKKKIGGRRKSAKKGYRKKS